MFYTKRTFLRSLAERWSWCAGIPWEREGNSFGKYYLPQGRDAEVWREMAQNLWFTGCLNQDVLRTVGAMSNDGKLGSQHIFKFFQRWIEASFYLLPTDRLRAQYPKGYRNCLHSSALFWWPGPARAKHSLVWSEMEKKTCAGGETRGRDLLLGSGEMGRGLKSCFSLTLMKLIFIPFLEINEIICIVIFSDRNCFY